MHFSLESNNEYAIRMVEKTFQFLWFFFDFAVCVV